MTIGTNAVIKIELSGANALLWVGAWTGWT
jgi:hypothetical protein